VKQCPACGAELPADASACAHCGGWWLPDGSFHTPWDEEMARRAAERQRKVEWSERLGRLGRPLPLWFLDSRSGCGVVAAVAIALLVAAAAATLT
jgi:hypothetical protein